MCFYRYNHTLKLCKTVITWWNVRFKMNMGSSCNNQALTTEAPYFGIIIQCRVTYSGEGFRSLSACAWHFLWVKKGFLSLFPGISSLGISQGCNTGAQLW